MKKLLEEFKEFINKGNVMDLAVAVIIGGAFTAIVTSLTDDIINPLISMIGGGGTDAAGNITKGMQITFNGATVDFGAFISAIINFLIVALVVFFLVKGVNTAQKQAEKLAKKGKEGEPEKIAPTCPYCLDEVKVGATKCNHCGSQLPEPAKETIKK